MASFEAYALTWDLDSIAAHPESETFRQAIDAFRDDLNSVATVSDELPVASGDASVVGAWGEFLSAYGEIRARQTELNAFVGCHAAADAENRVFQQLEAELSALGPIRQRIDTNIEFALKEADDAEFEEFCRSDEELKRVAFFLHDSRKRAEMRLPKAQESLAADLSVDGIHAWGRLYDRVSGSLRISLMERGEVVEKSPGQVQFDSPERAIRENNFLAADKAWSTIGDVCAEALNHISGTRLTMYRHLGFTDHLEAPLRYNRMRRETLDAMWGSISAGKSMLSPYLERKAQLLGLEKLSWFDLQAPLPSAGAKSSKISYDEACDRVIETFSEFSPELGAFARTAIEKRWIEVENREGKRQGGFCTDLPVSRESRIFMTYTDTPDSLSTLAHELGHAYHTYVLRDEPLLLQDYPMNLAETASTFAEAVVGEQRLREADTAEEIEILDGMLGDAVAFLMNIHARFIFEDRFHQERKRGELSSERLTELMLDAQRIAYGDALSADGWNGRFWISKLHFYISELPFYNFPYTFGYLLSLGVYALGRESNGDFAEQYRRLLIATGGSDTEAAVSSTMGYDLSDGEFWERSLSIVDSR
ncbi:MAG: oligoendopeptidase F, partial [Planctomycetaceae bacterium]|nr:oligoendopeptidase F [Planctomycetaceae bacterium]